MRVYHFLPAKYALEDIAEKHIRVSQLDGLNDPFELWCCSQPDPKHRTLMRNFKDHMARLFGVLCFCSDWHNPVLWSHYADKHRGMCLGFDIRDQLLSPVQYLSQRTPMVFPDAGEDEMKQLLYTKYVDWHYEEEWRCFIQLNDAIGENYFYDFDDKVVLREVIAGPLCATPKTEIDAALNGHGNDVQIIKARLAFESFRIVVNKRGFSSD